MRVLMMFVFFLASCTSNDEEAMAPSPISFTEVGKGALHGAGTEGIAQSNRVIDNESDWQNLITQMNAVNRVTSDFAETAIDFSQYTVIAIFLDVKPSGWEVSITAIEEHASNIKVFTTEQAFANTTITQPFHIVKIPTSTKAIEFE